MNLACKEVKVRYNYRIMTKFSATPVYKSAIKSQEWKHTKTERKLDRMNYGGAMERKTGFREYGVTTYHFEYIGGDGRG